MPSIQASGLRTNYETVGKGPVLLLLHGWANTWESWLPIIPFLSNHYTLVLPDLPGCGKTETPKEGWTTTLHATWLQDFLLQFSTLNSQLSIFSAVGHSYGGKILLEFTSGNYNPQPIKLVLIDSSGIPNILTTQQKLLQTFARLTPSFLKKHIGTTMRGKVYGTFGADSDYVSANEFGKKTLQKILSEDYTERLAHVAQPTLLLWGREDTATPMWAGESMHTLIPLNQLKTFDTGHFPHQVFPEQISKEICQFL